MSLMQKDLLFQIQPISAYPCLFDRLTHFFYDQHLFLPFFALLSLKKMCFSVRFLLFAPLKVLLVETLKPVVSLQLMRFATLLVSFFHDLKRADQLPILLQNTFCT